MAQLTCRRVVRRGGLIRVRWSDGTEQEFQDVAQLREVVREALNDGGLRDIMRTLLLAHSIRTAADGSLLDTLDGKTITLELSGTPSLGVA